MTTNRQTKRSPAEFWNGEPNELNSIVNTKRTMVIRVADHPNLLVS